MRVGVGLKPPPAPPKYFQTEAGILLLDPKAASLSLETPSGPSPAYEQQWNYANTSAAIAASMGTPAGTCTLMTEGGIPTSTTDKFMRTQYPGNGTEGSVNLDYLLGLGSGTREAWFELWIRFDDAWGATSDDKTWFVFSNGDGNRRWEIHYGSWANQAGTAGSIYGAAGNGAWGATVSSLPDFSAPQYGALSLSDVWDGDWHRHRLYLRMNTQGQSDGAFYWWFDDKVLISDQVQGVSWEPKYGTNVGAGNLSADYFHSMRLGANADPDGSGIRDWGPIRIYTTNPGWPSVSV